MKSRDSMFRSDDDPTLETLDFTVRIGSTPTSSYFCLYLYAWMVFACANYCHKLPKNSQTVQGEFHSHSTFYFTLILTQKANYHNKLLIGLSTAYK